MISREVVVYDILPQAGATPSSEECHCPTPYTVKLAVSLKQSRLDEVKFQPCIIALFQDLLSHIGP